MSTRFEQVEAQRLAFESRNIRLRHLIGPVELEHLLLMRIDHARLLVENEKLKEQVDRFTYATTPKDPK